MPVTVEQVIMISNSVVKRICIISQCLHSQSSYSLGPENKNACRHTTRTKGALPRYHLDSPFIRDSQRCNGLIPDAPTESLWRVQRTNSGVTFCGCHRADLSAWGQPFWAWRTAYSSPSSLLQAV